ncbi:DUF6134 family protein [Azospirillum sp.]|uniref:DUF6134 family protein n=1 Tax=Azospirillum sp. TaxID=34012 RepID=UPI003D7588FF
MPQGAGAVETAVSGGRVVSRAAGVALLIASFWFAGSPQAAEPKVLTYSILMDGSPVGQEQVRVQPQGDTVKVDVTASTRVKVLFLNFRYDHERQEVWRGGKLESMQARTDDDGKPHSIEMARKGDAWALTVDGKAATAVPTALPLTLWTPEVLKRPTLLSVIDAQPYSVTSQALGTATVDLGTRKVEAQHHRISGGVDRDLWYAADGTLLKAQFKRSGYDVVYLLK